MKAAGVECGFAFDFDTWHDPRAVLRHQQHADRHQDNGYGGLDAELVFNKTALRRPHEGLEGLARRGLRQDPDGAGRQEAGEAFADGSCASTSLPSPTTAPINNTQARSSSGTSRCCRLSRHQAHQLAGRRRLALGHGGQVEGRIRGGCRLPQIRHGARDRRGIHRREHRLHPGHDRRATSSSKTEGFYKDPKHAGREVAIASLTASEVTPLTRGIRLGNFTSIRAEIRAELEAAFTGQKDMQAALDDAVARGNEILRRYEQTYRAPPCPDPTADQHVGRAAAIAASLSPQSLTCAGRADMEKRATFSQPWLAAAFIAPQLLLVFVFFYWPTGRRSTGRSRWSSPSAAATSGSAAQFRRPSSPTRNTGPRCALAGLRRSPRPLISLGIALRPGAVRRPAASGHQALPVHLLPALCDRGPGRRPRLPLHLLARCRLRLGDQPDLARPVEPGAQRLRRADR